MGGDDARHSPRRKRSRERDPERKAKKRSKYDDSTGGRKHKHKARDSKLQIVDDDPNDDDMWVEKNIDMDGDWVSRLSNRQFSYPLSLCDSLWLLLFPPQRV